MRWRLKNVRQIGVDIHSHLIPGIDDGAPSLDQSRMMVDLLYKSGFKKLITTPHIHPRYPNKESQIMEGLEKLKNELKSVEYKIEIEAAAEYYVDDEFIDKVKNKADFLSFGDNYILIECSFITKPLFFESVIFSLKAQGYNPVLAHPERYKFLEGDIEWLNELKGAGLLFQVTLGSIGGYYGTMPRKLGIKLIKNGMVEFLGSDLHKPSQIEYLNIGLGSGPVQNLVKSGNLLNNELI